MHSYVVKHVELAYIIFDLINKSQITLNITS